MGQEEVYFWFYLAHINMYYMSCSCHLQMILSKIMYLRIITFVSKRELLQKKPSSDTWKKRGQSAVMQVSSKDPAAPIIYGSQRNPWSPSAWLRLFVRSGGQAGKPLHLGSQIVSKVSFRWHGDRQTLFSATAVCLVTLQLLACSPYTGDIGRGIWQLLQHLLIHDKSAYDSLSDVGKVEYGLPAKI